MLCCSLTPCVRSLCWGHVAHMNCCLRWVRLCGEEVGGQGLPAVWGGGGVGDLSVWGGVGVGEGWVGVVVGQELS